MTKSQLLDEIHKKRNSHFTKQQVAAVIDDIFDLIKNSLAHDERVEIRNFETPVHCAKTYVPLSRKLS